MKKTYKLSKLSLSILICFLLAIATLVPTAIYAKYVKTENMTPETAQVASWLFDCDDQSGTCSYNLSDKIHVPGDSANYTFTVKNFDSASQTEVATECKITLKLVGNMPLTCTLTENSTQKASLDVATNQTSTVYTANMQPSQTTITYTVNISWPSTQSGYNVNNELCLFTINIEATQID